MVFFDLFPIFIPMKPILRKISVKLHLWLALISGIVVFIVCLTGCMYMFKDEINDATQPWRFVKPEQKAMLLPSQILKIAGNVQDKQMMPSAITYQEAHDAVLVDYWDKNAGTSSIYINPYTGAVQKVKNSKPGEIDFFSFVLKGHRHLWLPQKIGKPIVGYSVLMFVIILITGMILWWPKNWNKKSIKRLFTIKWNSSFGKINYDLHNVLGGYTFIVLILVSFTGLIWSFSWFSESVYLISSGGEKLKAYALPKSDLPLSERALKNPLDRLYIQLRNEEPDAKTFYFALPSKVDDVIRVSIVHKRNSYYRTDNLFFDQYTLKSLKGEGPYAGKYKEANAADKLRRMNLDIHDGRIMGLPGKILVFLCALFGATLPVTGFILWLRKKRKTKAGNPRK